MRMSVAMPKQASWSVMEVCRPAALRVCVKRPTGCSVGLALRHPSIAEQKEERGRRKSTFFLNALKKVVQNRCPAHGRLHWVQGRGSTPGTMTDAEVGSQKAASRANNMASRT